MRSSCERRVRAYSTFCDGGQFSWIVNRVIVGSNIKNERKRRAYGCYAHALVFVSSERFEVCGLGEQVVFQAGEEAREVKDFKIGGCGCC